MSSLPPESRAFPFCAKCTAETTSQNAGSIVSINGIGTRFDPDSSARCDECGSILKEKRFCIAWIPIRSLGWYHVVYRSDGRYYSRRLK